MVDIKFGYFSGRGLEVDLRRLYRDADHFGTLVSSFYRQ
jgi:hypothetical protein